MARFNGELQAIIADIEEEIEEWVRKPENRWDRRGLERFVDESLEDVIPAYTATRFQIFVDNPNLAYTTPEFIDGDLGDIVGAVIAQVVAEEVHEWVDREAEDIWSDLDDEDEDEGESE